MLELNMIAQHGQQKDDGAPTRTADYRLQAIKIDGPPELVLDYYVSLLFIQSEAKKSAISAIFIRLSIDLIKRSQD